MDTRTSDGPITIYKLVDAWLQETSLYKHFYILPGSDRTYMVCISCDSSKLPVLFFDDTRISNLDEDVDLCDVRLFDKMRKMMADRHNTLLSSHRIEAQNFLYNKAKHDIS